MANPEHLAKLKEGVEAWNTWRKAGIIPDLSGANLNLINLSGMDLTVANLTEATLAMSKLRAADLSGANLSGAKLYRANLRWAKLCGARLREADLSGANLNKTVLRDAVLRDAKLGWTDLSGADLSGADLSRVSLTDADLDNTDLTSCRIYGISVWNVKLQNTTQTNLVITRSDEPTITVDNLELAQFIYLLLKHEKLRDVLNAVTQRGVLLLGRFSDGGLERLQAIADKLRELKYLPIIFDFDRPESRDYTETVKTLVGLSRFVIVELSGPSVPQELYATVPHFKIPFVPIMRKGSRHYAIFTDLLGYPWVLSPVEFENTENLLELIPAKIIEPAEDKAKARQEQLSNLFNR